MASTFFYVQNHEIEIAKDSAETEPVVTGDFSRAYNGLPLATIQHIRDSWKASTTLMLPKRAKFLIALLNGEGHTWDFDDDPDFLYSSKGYYPDAGYANCTRNTAGSKFGAASLELDAGEQVEFDLGYNWEWTVMLWKGNSTFSSSNHYIVNSAGQKWVDGVRNDGASTPFITETAGEFFIGDLASVAQQYFDDLVIIPEDISAEWAEDFGTMALAFSALPRLKVRGAFLRDRIYSAVGRDVKAKLVMGTLDGTYYNDLMSVSFTLDEFARIG